MIGPIDRNLNITAVEEKLGLNSGGSVNIDVPPAGLAVITNVPCIHATEIVVMVETDNKLKHVYLDLYGGARTLMVSVSLGAVAAGTTAIFKYNGGIPQTYAVRLVPDLLACVVKVWTCAR